MDRKRRRSSKGWRGFLLSARTRRLKASQDSSRLWNRAGEAARSESQANSARTSSVAAFAAMGAAKVMGRLRRLQASIQAATLSAACDRIKSSIEMVKILVIVLKDLPGQGARNRA